MLSGDPPDADIPKCVSATATIEPLFGISVGGSGAASPGLSCSLLRFLLTFVRRLDNSAVIIAGGSAGSSGAVARM